MKNKSREISLVFGILILFVFSAVTPLVMGDKELIAEKYAFDRYYDNFQTLPSKHERRFHLDYYKNEPGLDEIIEEELPSTIASGGLMNSSWPMKCHNLRHTAQSPYSTADNPGTEIWRFRSEHHLGGTMESSAVIGDDGTIYFGTMGTDHKLYAINPDGTRKWWYETGLMIWSTPAIAEDGTIYITSYDGYLHALYSNNGTLKWKKSGSGSLSSSPAIGEDGTIYFGAMGPYEIGRIWAVNPNGTEKWHYDTGYWITSDPAIGDNGTIYIGSGDSGLYAMYPNGTLRWQFETGDYVKGHPSIAEDGTIYIPSMDDNLYALYPNGTLKWEVNTDYGAISSAAIGEDGTVYISTTELYAIYPNNGTVRWSLDVGGDNSHPSPAISADGTIYVSTGTGKSLVAVNPDGTEKWRKQITNLHARSSPIIGEDGTIYVGSSWKEDDGDWTGYLHAFGQGEPKKIEIQYPESGKLYLFGKDLGATPRNNTVIIGNINVEVHAYSEDEIESVNFYIDGSHQFSDTEPPFEWTMNKRFGKWPLMRHTLKVEASYKGGCFWTEEIDVWYFHLFKN